jgi:assimilatory nitrate reductase catalytic subunit
VIICHCTQATDRLILREVRRGANSCEAVGRVCGAGTACGGCKPSIDDIIRREAGPSLLALTVLQNS